MTLPAMAELRQLATGHFVSRCLHAVAEAGIADHLDDAPMTSARLAGAAGCDADALERMLRLLATAGVFASSELGWTHTETSRRLRSDHPESMRAFARMIGNRISWAAAGELGYTLRSGRAGAERVAAGGLWAHLAAHPDEARVFDEAMTAKSIGEIPAVVAALDLGRYHVIADVGGGRGHLLRGLLDAAPHARGVLYDRPDVVAAAPASPRLERQGGEFFRDPLPRADAYLLSNILHDWDDARAIEIVRAIRAAATPHSELLVVELLLPDSPEPHPAKTLDVVMLSITGGRERTAAGYASLFEAGGFRLDRVLATASPVVVLVGLPS